MSQPLCEVYELLAAANDCAGLLVVDERDLDRLEPFDGTPMSDHWEPVRMRWETEGDARPVCDFTRVNTAPVFSRRALDALGDLLEGRGELLPLEVVGGGEYRIFNVTRLVDALDEERSDIDFLPSGRILEIDRYEFEPEMVAGETIFKLPGLRRSRSYVTDTFRRRAEAAGLTGFRWAASVWSGPLPADSAR